MFSSLHDALIEWNKATNDRAKLQHSYVALALIVFIVAGIVGLINYQYGQALLQIALVAIGAFLVNAFVWALLQSFVFTRLSVKSRQTKRK
ncbi:MAG TPA: hypothetical protein PKD68_01595 [Candidatus Saccharibacteria bacterium]|jgi:Flp pilus assembly protein TadB|nr:hypothetical protein [Candidatus Saccharibacteria bacterium]